MEHLPNELLLELLLKTNNEKELMNMCSINKRIYNLCRTEVIAKHLINNIINIKKPNIFTNYRNFLKHYLELSKYMGDKIDRKNFYNQFNNIFKYKNKSYIKKFEDKFNIY